MSIITNEEIFDFLQMDTEAEEKVLIETLRDMTETFVEKYIGMSLSFSNYKEYYDGNGSKSLMLNKYPVTSITEIKFYNWDRTTYVVQDTSYYIFYETLGEIYHIYGFPKGKKNIYVDYNAGYTDIPEDYKYVIKAIVKRLYQQYTNNSEGIKSWSLGDLSITKNDLFFSDEISLIINKYRKIII